MSALLRRSYPFIPPSLSIDHLVIGGGVVGLAVGERLTQAFPRLTTFIIERHGQVGQETSSRNSEVIHSGLYYPSPSSKAALCTRGRQLLYARCEKDGIPFRKTGKLILATDVGQVSYLDGLVKNATAIEKETGRLIPLQRISGDEARSLEPDLGDGVMAALLSPETGIVDSHALMESMQSTVEDSEMGEMVFGTSVVRIDAVEARGDRGGAGWVVQTVTRDKDGVEGERSSVLAGIIVNAAGLNAHHMINQVLPESTPRRLYFAKGSYFSYRGPGVSSIQHLLYPCPDPTSLAGLGTHLTMSLANDIRFGPDIEWISAPLLDGEEEMDFWTKMLGPSEERLETAVEEVRKWLPNIDPSCFSPDYSGIRPKLSPPGSPASDFSITTPFKGFVSLEGIESPGLTSSLAIAEKVESMVRIQRGSGRGSKVSEVHSINDWA